ncbi:MAG: TetR/AcrR family transcriptional regulator [Paraperlucidibaca sp.]
MISAVPVKTRHRILATSLQLFNEQGERQVTTNHLAAAMGMSPGNLYYHFKNKDAIIGELFTHYAERMAATLTFPDDHPLTQADKANLFERVLNVLWDFRFLHRDMTHLLESAKLSAQYRTFSVQVLEQLRELYRVQIAAGLIVADDDDIDTLAITIWITATNWVNFLHTTGLFNASVGNGNGDITEDMLRRGILHVICLEAPYLRGEAKAGLVALKARYGTALASDD